MRMGMLAAFGLAAGAIVALGRMSAAQLGHVGQALLSLALAYGLTLLPWVLTALFAWRWWHQKQLARIWYQSWIEESAINTRARALQATQPGPTRRKRATR